jgi:hypothetical protein
MTIICNSKTVTDRLILHVDFANPKCYPGTGTAFYDMVDKTRLPGDSYGSATVANGTMNFLRPDGRTEHQVASIPDLHTFTGASAFTFSIAYRLNAYPPVESANRSGVMMKGAFGSSYGITLQHSGDSNGVRTYTQLMYGLRNADSSTILDLTPAVQIFPGQWCKADMTYRFYGSNLYLNFYVNGILASSYSAGGYATPPDIADIGGSLAFAGSILAGNNVYCDQSIASYSVYSKELSAQEIQQNFLSTKARLKI